MELINRLKEVQKAESLSDAKFAKKIGIHRTTWIRIKTNQIGLSTRVLQKVLTAYPGLKKEVNIFLLGNATYSSKQGRPKLNGDVTRRSRTDRRTKNPGKVRY